MTLAEQIREARKQAGLTQLEAADKLGVTNVYLSQLENGHRFPSVLMLVCFASLYRTEFVIRAPGRNSE